MNKYDLNTSGFGKFVDDSLNLVTISGSINDLSTQTLTFNGFKNWANKNKIIKALRAFGARISGNLPFKKRSNVSTNKMIKIGIIKMKNLPFS